MKNKGVYIGIFGKRNQGKSALINALTGQQIAIVSEVAGTTTDPVRKSMEIFGIGPVVLVDTAGLDDDSELGRQRMRKTKAVFSEIDLALLVFSGNAWGREEADLAAIFTQREIPFVLVHNQSDLLTLDKELQSRLEKQYQVPVMDCSALQRTGIPELVQAMVRQIPASAYLSTNMVEDLVKPGELVVLVMPQDGEAPEGRLILPQVQMIRDLLDIHAIPVPLQPEELPLFLKMQRPSLVITDSQVFAQVRQSVPEDLPLTSFSILLARAKGHFDACLRGTPHIGRLQDGDHILMLESCTHVTSCEDIGRVKIPRLMQQFTGKQLNFTFVSALDPLPDLSGFALACQCGACMVTKRQIANRLKKITDYPLPLTNYGMAIAYMTGIFDRVTSMFK
ncbi:MAG: [FeFe] hydrogenase H-cluster maturation GTPase HydF [Bacteroidales bacterium]|nr:[FeFe] hydrogenase H-cluster maturation GTPase HydF [Bacteroidales bacterium]